MGTPRRHDEGVPKVKEKDIESRSVKKQQTLPNDSCTVIPNISEMNTLTRQTAQVAITHTMIQRGFELPVENKPLPSNPPTVPPRLHLSVHSSDAYKVPPRVPRRAKSEFQRSLQSLANGPQLEQRASLTKSAISKRFVQKRTIDCASTCIGGNMNGITYMEKGIIAVYDQFNKKIVAIDKQDQAFSMLDEDLCVEMVSMPENKIAYTSKQSVKFIKLRNSKLIPSKRMEVELQGRGHGIDAFRTVGGFDIIAVTLDSDNAAKSSLKVLDTNCRIQFHFHTSKLPDITIGRYVKFGKDGDIVYIADERRRQIVSVSLNNSSYDTPSIVRCVGIHTSFAAFCTFGPHKLISIPAERQIILLDIHQKAKLMFEDMCCIAMCHNQKSKKLYVLLQVSDERCEIRVYQYDIDPLHFTFIDSA